MIDAQCRSRRFSAPKKHAFLPDHMIVRSVHRHRFSHPEQTTRNPASRGDYRAYSGSKFNALQKNSLRTGTGNFWSHNTEFLAKNREFSPFRAKTQSDTETAELARERRELEENPEFGLDELTTIYVKRGVEPALGVQSRSEMGWVFFEATRIFCPDFADVFVRG